MSKVSQDKVWVWLPMRRMHTRAWCHGVPCRACTKALPERRLDEPTARGLWERAAHAVPGTRPAAHTAPSTHAAAQLRMCADSLLSRLPVLSCWAAGHNQRPVCTCNTRGSLPLRHALCAGPALGPCRLPIRKPCGPSH